MSVFRTARKDRALLRRIWQAQRPWILLAALSLLILIAGQELVYGHFDLRQAFVDYYANLSTELLSIALTLSVISSLSRRRDRKLRDEERDKAMLIKRLPTASPEDRREIAKKLRADDWLVDGTLNNLNLSGADLCEMDLTYADMEGINLANSALKNSSLSGADMRGANLSHASLDFARCKHVRLFEANLAHASAQHADLSDADLRYAELEYADLRGAILDAADLRGANLRDADLSGACLELRFDDRPFSGAKFDGATTLPDGSKWTPESDLRRFTDTDHAEFWACPVRESQSA